MLVEDNPDYEKAIFNVETDGQISPVDAFKNAVTVMYAQMSVFNKVFNLVIEDANKEPEEEKVDLKDLIFKIEDLHLSARSFNSLDKSGIKYLGELVLMSEVEVRSIKNLGKKSFNEISSKLEALNFPIGSALSENVASALRKKLEQLKS